MKAKERVALTVAAVVAVGLFCGILARHRDPLRAGLVAALWFFSTYGLAVVAYPGVVRWWRSRRPPQG